MTRRSVSNERYTAEQTKESQSKKSASKAKPARKAASSVVEATKPKKSRKEQKREYKEKQQKRLQREQARYGTVSSQEAIDIANIKEQRIKSWRKLWWLCIGVAVASIIGAYFLSKVNMNWFIIVISLSYITLGAALFIEFGKIRKLKRTTYVVTKKTKKAIKHEVEEFDLKGDPAKSKLNVLNAFKSKTKASTPVPTNPDLPLDESSEH